MSGRERPRREQQVEEGQQQACIDVDEDEDVIEQCPVMVCCLMGIFAAFIFLFVTLLAMATSGWLLLFTPLAYMPVYLASSAKKEKVKCPLCNSKVSITRWKDGSHRTLCQDFYLEVLDSYPVVLDHATCIHCVQPLRVWPPSKTEELILCDGCNRQVWNWQGCALFRCFPCFYTLCLQCAKRRDREFQTRQVQEAVPKEDVREETPPPSYDQVV